MTRSSRTFSVLAVVAIFLMTTVGADHIGDAGTGGDAGNTRDTALLLPGWGYYEAYVEPKDDDWYRIESGLETPRCVSAEVWAENNLSTQLLAVGFDRERAVNRTVFEGTTATFAVAGPSLQTTFFHAKPAPNKEGEGNPARPGHYTFDLGIRRAPSSASNDAFSGTDAGTGADALWVEPGCVGGRTSPVGVVLDSIDGYKFNATSGDTIWYSLGATLDLIEVSILDPAGNQVGYTIENGQAAGVTIDTSGTYTMQASQSSGIEDVGYVIGLEVGPDPGNGCRPYCLSIS